MDIFSQEEKVVLLLQRAHSYLSIGLEKLFKHSMEGDDYNFLKVLQHVLNNLLEKKDILSEEEWIELIYQAESLARLAVQEIFLERKDADTVNYLGTLEKLLVEARKEQEFLMMLV